MPQRHRNQRKANGLPPVSAPDVTHGSSARHSVRSLHQENWKMAGVISSELTTSEVLHPLDRPTVAGKWFMPAFAVLVLGGLVYVGYALSQDLTEAVAVPWILLGLALLIALGFEFVNGFHDTANAVATVIYTHSLPAELAVMWSGLFNFLGVLTASGAVAFGIISLLPVELILQVNSGSGLAMV